MSNIIKNYQPYLLLSISSFLMLSCVAYQPQMADIPLIHEKKDLRIDAGLSLVKGNIGGTFSYGVSDKIAVQVHGNTMFDGTKHNYLQAAGGYYKHYNNNAVLELYGGLGYGNIYARQPSTGGHMDGNQQLYFTQLNFGKISIDNGKIDLGIGLKTGLLFSEIQDNNYFYTPAEGDLKYNYSILLGEPTAFIRFGGERIKFNLKAGAVAMHELSNSNQYFPFSWWNIGFGVNFNF
ncbi:hypothetical protein [Marivirga sp.]|uniref:hypothetical protein n=1 Tax=Marivirga sp. TaxID=2018662 RepID=UPI002D7FF1B0|nr:hypothetical protein [Marivirga sp.]HET8859814.1 hypothetical protein [Marivirga sp.]